MEYVNLRTKNMHGYLYNKRGLIFVKDEEYRTVRRLAIQYFKQGADKTEPDYNERKSYFFGRIKKLGTYHDCGDKFIPARKCYIHTETFQQYINNTHPDITIYPIVLDYGKDKEEVNMDEFTIDVHRLMCLVIGITGKVNRIKLNKISAFPNDLMMPDDSTLLAVEFEEGNWAYTKKGFTYLTLLPSQEWEEFPWLNQFPPKYI